MGLQDLREADHSEHHNEWAAHLPHQSVCRGTSFGGSHLLQVANIHGREQKNHNKEPLQRSSDFQNWEWHRGNDQVASVHLFGRPWGGLNNRNNGGPHPQQKHRLHQAHWLKEQVLLVYSHHRVLRRLSTLKNSGNYKLGWSISGEISGYLQPYQPKTAFRHFLSWKRIRQGRTLRWCRAPCQRSGNRHFLSSGVIYK